MSKETAACLAFWLTLSGIASAQEDLAAQASGLFEPIPNLAIG